MSVFMQPLGTQTLSSPANYVTFTNIPQGYTDLVVELSVRTTQNSSGWTYMATMNNSSMVYGVYSHTTMRGFASAGTTGSFNATTSGINYIFMGTLNDASSLANAFTSTRMNIKSYTSGNPKRFIIDSVTTNNSGVVWNEGIAGTAAITAPITQLQFNPFNQNFAAGSTFTLYGVSNTYDTAIPTAPTIGTVTDQAGFASVAFTRATNDQAESYVVTSTPAGSTTYGSTTPIVTPAVLGTSYTYQVAAVNSLGTSTSAASSAVTTDNSFASIATASGSAGSYRISNIPQNYSHLQLRVYARTLGTNSSSLSVRLLFNEDGGTNYSYIVLAGNGSAASSGNEINKSNGPIVGYTVGNGAISNTYGYTVIDILDYSNTVKYKVTRSVTGTDFNGAGGFVAQFAGSWASFAPITSIQITSDDGGFNTASYAALYGIA